MRYEDVRRDRGVDGLLLRLKLFVIRRRQARDAIAPVADLSERDLRDIGVPLGFDRPVDWWRFR